MEIVNTEIRCDSFSSSFIVEFEYKDLGRKAFLGNFYLSGVSIELTNLKVFESDDTLRRNAPVADYTQEEGIIKQIIKEYINGH